MLPTASSEVHRRADHMDLAPHLRHAAGHTEELNLAVAQGILDHGPDLGQSQRHFINSLRENDLTIEQRCAFTAKNVHEHHKNRRITRKQVHTLRNKLRQHAYTDHGMDLAAEFRRMDVHRRGSLSYDDFAHAVRRLVPMDDDQCRNLLHVVDTDGSGTISYGEVERFALGDRMPAHLPHLQDAASTPLPGSPSPGFDEVRSDGAQAAEACYLTPASTSPPLLAPLLPY